MLAFFGVHPDAVAELGAAGGYTAELLARAVGPRGGIWAELALHPRPLRREALERTARPAIMRSVVRVDREFDDPLPPKSTISTLCSSSSSITTRCGWASIGRG